RSDQRFGESASHNDNIQPDGPVLDVVIVESGPLRYGCIAREAVHLRPAGQSGTNPVPLVVMRDDFREPGSKEWPLGPRADQRHVAPNHIEQLGKLVKVGEPKPAPQPGAVLNRYRPL